MNKPLRIAIRVAQLLLASAAQVLGQDSVRPSPPINYLGQVDLRWAVPLGIGIIAILVTILHFWLKEKIKAPLEREIQALTRKLETSQDDRDGLAKRIESSELDRCQAAVRVFYHAMRNSFVKVSCTALGIDDPHESKIVDGSLCVSAERCAVMVRSILEFYQGHSKYLLPNMNSDKDDLEYMFMAARVLLLESVSTQDLEKNRNVVEALLTQHLELAKKFPNTLRMNSLLKAQFQKHTASTKQRAGQEAREDFGAAVRLYEDATVLSQKHNGTSGEWSPSFSGKAATLELMFDCYDDKDILNQLIKATLSRKDQLAPITRDLRNVHPILDHANLAECYLINGQVDEALAVLEKTDVWCDSNQKTIMCMSPKEDAQKLFGQIKGLTCFARMIRTVKSPEVLTEDKVEELTHELKRYRLLADEYAAPLVDFGRRLLELRLSVDSDKLHVATAQYSDAVDEAREQLQAKPAGPSFSGPRILLKLLYTNTLNNSIFDGQVDVAKLEPPKNHRQGPKKS